MTEQHSTIKIDLTDASLEFDISPETTGNDIFAGVLGLIFQVSELIGESPLDFIYQLQKVTTNLDETVLNTDFEVAN